MSEITRCPLCWPDNVARTAPQLRKHAQFELRSIDYARKFVIEEINRLNKRTWSHTDDKVIISSNGKQNRDGTLSGTQSEPADPGIAVFFTLRFARNGKWRERPCVLTCDKWNKMAYNLTAIAKDIEAQRARERWGCSTIEQAFQGYLAIPERVGGEAWWIALDVKPDSSREVIQYAYKRLAQIMHPDKGGSHAGWLKIQTAYDQAMAQFQ
jgi:hypothetical protein